MSAFDELELAAIWGTGTPPSPETTILQVNTTKLKQQLYSALKNALGTSVAASLNTAIFVFLISIANGMEGNPDATAYIATIQAICVVPFLSPLYASSAEMSIARGRKASQTVLNSIKRAADRLAREMAVPQIISLMSSFLLSFTFSNHNAAKSTRKFIPLYILAVVGNNLIITNQETFMANDTIKPLILHNAIYLSTAVGTFLLLHQFEPLNGLAASMSFTLSSIVAKVTGDAILHWQNHEQASLFNTYKFNPQLVNKFYQSIRSSGIGVLAQLGLADLAILSVLLSSNFSIAAAQANGPASQYYILLTVIPFQAIQSLTAKFIGQQHGDFLEQAKVLLRRNPTAQIDTGPAQQHMKKIILTSGSILVAELTLMTSVIGALLTPLSTLIVHPDAEQYDETMDLISRIFPYTAIAGIAATLTEFLNATARKTGQHETKDNWVQGCITAPLALFNIILILTNSIDFEASWQIFMIAPLLRLIYQGWRTISAEIDYKALAKDALSQDSLAMADSLAHTHQPTQTASSPHFDLNLQERLSPELRDSSGSPTVFLQQISPSGTRERGSKDDSPGKEDKPPVTTSISSTVTQSNFTARTAIQSAWPCVIC